MRTQLLLGIHCHQPVDNFSNVVDEAIDKSYRAFFEVVKEFGEFKFSIHFSGWLLEYIKLNDKKLFKLMQELAKRGQIEFLSGGYYEPILASIPSKDRVLQIKKLNSFIKRNFKQEPKGLWLTERVFDNAIIEDLIKAKIEYILVDDYHFITAGFHKEHLNGYYVTEESNYKLNIFPINKDLRYIVPFKSSDRVLEHLENLATDLGDGAIIFDDGEKFGLWPNTYEWVFEKEWLKEFIQKVLSSDRVETTLYSDYLESKKPLGLAYLPTNSYYEMSEWSLREYDALNLERIREHSKMFGDANVDKFVKGSIWKNFLVKYPESNRIHKRALELSRARLSLKSKEFEENLFKAQTNDVLWHGVFGGLYLPNLRDNAYRFIINCENVKYAKKRNLMEIVDNNFDGYEELKFVNEDSIFIFDSAYGGQLTELSLRDRLFNFQNTLSRYRESYHSKIENPIQVEHSQDEEGIDTIHSINSENLEEYRKLLKFDWHQKNSFIDHITDSNFSLDSFDYCNYQEYGDFANQPFELEKLSQNSFKFKRDGGIYRDGVKSNTKLQKIFKIDSEKIDFEIDISTEDALTNYYLLEMNFHFANLDEVKINGSKTTRGELKSLKTLKIEDRYTQKLIEITFRESCDIYFFEVNSVSQSESGFDTTNQALSIGFKFEFSRDFKINGRFRISNLNS